MIYGITDCPACLRACAMLMEEEIEYAFVETDFAPSYRKFLKKKWKWGSFPIVVKLLAQSRDCVGPESCAAELIGGYEDLLYLLNKSTQVP